MGSWTSWVLLTLILAYIRTAAGVELTFELLDNAKDCFHEDIRLNTTVTLEFQVVTGGSYDVDVTLEDPSHEIIYRQVKSQFDSHTFTTLKEGTYGVCFSNEFSTFSHKLVYMDFQVGDEPPLPGVGEHATVMTQMEMTTVEMHLNLRRVVGYQTHHRLRESMGSKRAEILNERVFWWSLTCTTAILFVSIGQVVILRKFFSGDNVNGLRSRKVSVSGF